MHWNAIRVHGNENHFGHRIEALQIHYTLENDRHHDKIRNHDEIRVWRHGKGSSKAIGFLNFFFGRVLNNGDESRVDVCFFSLHILCKIRQVLESVEFEGVFFLENINNLISAQTLTYFAQTFTLYKIYLNF